MNRDELKAKLDYYKALGYKVPQMKYIKTEEQIAGIREAGASLSGMLSRLRSYNELVKSKGKKRLVAAYANDSHTIAAVSAAIDRGIVEATLVGDIDTMKKVCAEEGIDPNKFEMVQEANDNKAGALAVKLINEGKGDFLMKGLLYGLVKERLVLNNGLYLQGHVADDHGKGEVLHGPCAGHGLEPAALWVGAAVKDALEGLAGDIGPMLLTGCHCQLGESHAGKSVGEDIVGRYDGLSFTGEGEVEVIVSVVAVFLQEITALEGALKPLRIFLHLIIEHSEHPHLPSLQPHELVRVKNGAVSVKAGEVAAKFLVL